MLEMILSAREDEEEFDKIPHHYNRNITKGFYDRDIVAHIAHFFLEGILNSYIFSRYMLGHPIYINVTRCRD